MHETYEDNIYQEQIIEYIDFFALSTEFFVWLAQDELEEHLIISNFGREVYERSSEYLLNGCKIFSGGWQLVLDRICPSFHPLLSTNPKLYTLLPQLRRLEKKSVSNTITEFNYTIVSQLFYKGRLCGSCWEIYDLPNLIQQYKARKASLEQLL